MLEQLRLVAVMTLSFPTLLRKRRERVRQARGARTGANSSQRASIARRSPRSFLAGLSLSLSTCLPEWLSKVW